MTIEFAPSKRSTVGIEWELQLIDRDSLDLRQAAQTVLDAVRPAGKAAHPRIHPEMLVNTVEITSAPRERIADAIADLAASVAELRAVTDPLRIDLASAGTHPFARPQYQRVTDKERYAELVRRTQYWGRQMLVYGVHVHVGIETRDKVLPILNALMTRFGVLQTLSASSPFWAGQDTGYASNRAMFFQQLPTAGEPLQLEDWAQFERYVSGMLKTGVIDAFNEVRWDVRPSPAFGTLEMRAFDACTNLTEVAALAALVQCLVEHYSAMYDAGERLPQMPTWFLTENKWRSARYGMDAILILDEDGEEELVTDTAAAMLAELRPTAERLGCAAELADVGLILDKGACYQRMRRVAQDAHEHLDDVVDLMLREMEAGRPL